ncbi:hypothetical protein SOVF_059050 isoform B [Spinacia oleracea]|nr:hypothetical protein SOVF_059050 isoform B [Spinacia oleracea]
MELVHSSLRTVHLSNSSFPPQKLNHHQNPPFPFPFPFPFPPSKPNSFKPRKQTSFQVSLSLTQQNSDDLFNNSLSILPNSPFSRITTAASTSITTPLSSTAQNSGENVHWMVIMDKPPNGFQSKADIINYYVATLEKSLGCEKDAQSCIYDASCNTHFGFCCIVDEQTSRLIAAMPGVLSVQPDEHFESENKDYEGDRLSSDASAFTKETDISKTKLFITGLSFYTSEKTLREAFEPFGELVEVKVIMDKISKRSKGYAFVEYSNEDAATTALLEMNGKIINGWMIVIDRAKMKPRRTRAFSSQDRM